MSSVSIHRSIIQHFSFEGKSIRSVYVEGSGTCLVSRDVYGAVGYDEESGKKQIQSLVPDRYKLSFGDVKLSIKQREEFFPLHHNTVLLKEAGLYCFLLRCKRTLEIQ